MSTVQFDDDDVSAELSGQALNKADFEDGAAIVHTIRRVDKKTFEARNNKPAETKRVLVFEGDKTLSLNKTNLRLLSKWFGPHTRAWAGQRVTVYRDESVSFGGQLVGGWRLRKPGKQDQVMASSDDDLDSGVPF